MNQKIPSATTWGQGFCLAAGLPPGAEFYIGPTPAQRVFRRMKTSCPSLFLLAISVMTARAQEARSGFELNATISGIAIASNGLSEEPRSGSVADAGVRSVLYPLWKISEHWAIAGAWQAVSRPYFYESFSTQGHGFQGSLLQGTLNYSRTANKRSMLFRVGELSTAFGSFLLHYDDAANPLVDLPMQYGYYYATVSSLPVAGAQLDLSGQKWDGRLQFANSSPVNPRSVFARDQYGNWAGGAGYTIRQGFRVGVSGYRGPYLDRQYRYFFPGEANPSTLPASALGLDVQWARGHWNLQGEWQRFIIPYTVLPTFREAAEFLEAKRVLHPRWYLATRLSGLNAKATGERWSLETALGFRPNTSQIIKFSYETERSSQGEYRRENTVAIQLVTTIRPLSYGWR
jgi:hypothetical protein